MSDDELKLNRRLFLQHSAMISATAGLCGIAMKTDALVQAEQQQVKAIRSDGPSPYPYLDPGG
jgi:hypothetical protein